MPAAATSRSNSTNVFEDANTDGNPRPHKRQRIHTATSDSDDNSSESDPLTSLPPSSSPTKLPTTPSRPSSQNPLKPLPPAILLVSLPSLLAHPPNHKFYVHSLVLSLTALRKCLTLPALSPEIECRAWTGLAEIGMRVIAGGLHENEDCPWAHGIEAEASNIYLRPSVGHVSLRLTWVRWTRH